MSENKQITVQEKNITDGVLARIKDMECKHDITFPKNYSYANALKSAYLILSETIDRDKKPVLQSCSQASICNALLDITRSAIPTYSSAGTFKAIPTDELSTYNRHVLKHRQKKSIGGFTILPFDTEHDVDEPLGFLIEHKELGKTVFITDSYYCIYKFGNVEHILIECNYSEDILDDLPPYRARVLKSHMSLETLKDTLKTWDLSTTKDITLIHISEGNGDPERFRREIQIYF